MYDTPKEIELYLDRDLECGCGRTHRVDIKAVEIGAGALERLPEYVRNFGYRYPYILCDPVTQKIAAERCEELLTTAGFETSLHVLEHLSYNEETLDEIVQTVPKSSDLMIAVGTGSITDITRYASFRLRLPCFTVATAAPMDGFAASVGILNLNGLKTTLPAHCTELIIGDTDILQAAPYRMTVAGFGDLIGKVSCLNDWVLAHMIDGEHICEKIVELVRSCVENALAQSEGLKAREPQVMGEIMRGLVLSGAAISLYGDSRPASGAEHHFSHFWETVLEQRGSARAMHGEQVAVGTVLVMMLAEELLDVEPDFDAARDFALAYDRSAWEAEIARVYGSAAEKIIAIEDNAHKNDVEVRLKRIDRMQQCWDQISTQLLTLPPAESLIRVLDKVGCPSRPEQIGIDKETLKASFLYAKEVRARYTILQTIYDLGLMERLADRVIARVTQ